jgi:hypothetical protein
MKMSSRTVLPFAPAPCRNGKMWCRNLPDNRVADEPLNVWDKFGMTCKCLGHKGEEPLGLSASKSGATRCQTGTQRFRCIWTNLT